MKIKVIESNQAFDYIKNGRIVKTVYKKHYEGCGKVCWKDGTKTSYDKEISN